MYADPVDQADALHTLITENRIKSIRSQGREINPSGFCHFCEEPVHGNKLFCDADCSTDYERTKRL